MWRNRKPITIREDYILGTDCREFYKLGITETRMLKDHPMILAELLGGWGKEKLKVLQGEDHLAHFGTKGGPNAVGRLDLQ